MRKIIWFFAIIAMHHFTLANAAGASPVKATACPSLNTSGVPLLNVGDLYCGAPASNVGSAVLLEIAPKCQVKWTTVVSCDATRNPPERNYWGKYSEVSYDPDDSSIFFDLTDKNNPPNLPYTFLAGLRLQHPPNSGIFQTFVIGEPSPAHQPLTLKLNKWSTSDY